MLYERNILVLCSLSAHQFFGQNQDVSLRSSLQEVEAQFGDGGAFSLSSISSLCVLAHYFHFPIGPWLLPVQPRLSFSVEGNRQLHSAHPLFAYLHEALVKVFFEPEE